MFARNAALGFAALGLLSGCASAAPTLAPWERLGLGGAVRPEMGAPQPGDRAPDLALPDDQGGFVRLSALRGQWVVLHFTASWCPYCDSEIEQLGRLADGFAGRGVKVLLVDVEQPASVWRPYAQTHVASRVLSARDETGASVARFAPPRAQPAFTDRAQAVLDATIVVDPGGIIRLFLLPDTAHFDPSFAGVTAELTRWVGAPTERRPRELLSPEQSVQLSLAPLGCGAQVSLRVAPGYHIMSDQPSQPAFIATTVLARSDDVELAQPVYPAPQPFAALGSTLSTFQGDEVVSVPCRAGTAVSTRSALVDATVRYQACTATNCLFPITRHISERLTFTTTAANAAP
jgi:peroxiredoxin